MQKAKRNVSDGVVEEMGENDTLIVKRLDNDCFCIFGENRDKIQASTVEGVVVDLDH